MAKLLEQTATQMVSSSLGVTILDQPLISLLQPLEHHLRDACLGSISEILEGDAPHLPRGAVAQAWGAAEVLRAWRVFETAG